METTRKKGIWISPSALFLPIAIGIPSYMSASDLVHPPVLVGNFSCTDVVQLFFDAGANTFCGDRRQFVILAVVCEEADGCNGSGSANTKNFLQDSFLMCIH